ncbi:hypothetical protein ILYODFUR_035692 [Ilyodon furcidens]|uniref:Uncharacterized protein n=1 Tax=Ilyodon furcidens TaxID=33524 RepID=A0ABV0UN85_9TELE
MSDDSSVAVSGDSLLASSDSSDATVIVHTNGGTRTHAEREVAKEMLRNVLQAKPGGQVILDEYDKMRTRRRLVNLLVANMVEMNGNTSMSNRVDLATWPGE